MDSLTAVQRVACVMICWKDEGGPSNLPLPFLPYQLAFSECTRAWLLHSYKAISKAWVDTSGGACHLLQVITDPLYPVPALKKGFRQYFWLSKQPKELVVAAP